MTDIVISSFNISYKNIKVYAKFQCPIGIDNGCKYKHDDLSLGFIINKLIFKTLDREIFIKYDLPKSA